MATTDQRVSILDKKTLGLVDLGTRFLSYLLDAARDAVIAVFPRRGLFAACAISAGGNDKFTLGTVYGTNGSGQIAQVSAADALITAVPFENTIAVPYYIGCTIAEGPSEAETNVRTGLAQYPDVKEFLGYLGTPDSVTDNGDGTLTFRVDAVTEAGVTNAGRTVRVWMVTPASSVTATAIEELTVAWAGGQNRITTAAAFGQTGTPSTTAADYRVMLLGPRVSRNTDLSAVAGVIYIGTVTGAGAGAPPAVFDVSAQYVYATAQGLVDDVLEQDAHGKWRVCVKADGSDSKTPQISVKDSTGARRVWIDEEGHFHHLDEPGAYDGVPFGGASSGSTATTQDNQLDALLPTNLLGSLNRTADQERILSAILANDILSGCAVSAGAGLTVDIASGTTLGSGRLIVQAAQPGFVVPDNSTFFVIWNGTAFDVSLTFPASTAAAAAWVTTLAGAVTAVVDLRLNPNDLDRKIDLNVGGPNAHFSTVYEAVRFVNGLASPGSGAPTRSWRILVRGSTAEPATIQFVANSVTIEGLGGNNSSTTGPARIVWSGNRALFDLNGKTDLHFRNLMLVYDDATAVAAVVMSRVAFDDTSGGGPQRLQLQHVRITAAQADRLHGFLSNSGGGQFSDVWIDNCNWDGASEFGISVSAASDFHVRNCRLSTGSTTQAPLTPGTEAGISLGGAGVGNIRIQHCRLSGWGNRGIVLSGVEGGRIDSCDVHSADVNGTTTKYVGIEIDSTCIRCWVTNCRTHTLGATAATAFGVQVAGDRVILQGNDCKVDGGAGAATGLDLTAASANCIAESNQTNAQGLVAGGGPHSIGALNRDDA